MCVALLSGLISLFNLGFFGKNFELLSKGKDIGKGVIREYGFSIT